MGAVESGPVRSMMLVHPRLCPCWKAATKGPRWPAVLRQCSRDPQWRTRGHAPCHADQGNQTKLPPAALGTDFWGAWWERYCGKWGKIEGGIIAKGWCVCQVHATATGGLDNKETSCWWSLKDLKHLALKSFHTAPWPRPDERFVPGH